MMSVYKKQPKQGKIFYFINAWLLPKFPFQTFNSRSSSRLPHLLYSKRCRQRRKIRHI